MDPAEHLKDPAKSAVMGLPEDLVFRTNGQLAIDILTEAFADGVRLDFVCPLGPWRLHPAGRAPGRPQPGLRAAGPPQLPLRPGQAALAWRDFMASDYSDTGQQHWLQSRGIDLLRGAGKLAGTGVVEVDGVRHTAEHVVVASGAEPIVPPVPGLRDLEGVWGTREAHVDNRQRQSRGHELL
jgi:hypothetical protein